MLTVALFVLLERVEPPVIDGTVMVSKPQLTD